MARGDDELRRLERLAAQGDPAVRPVLHDERARRGLPLIPDEWGFADVRAGGPGPLAPAHDLNHPRYHERWFFSNGFGANVEVLGPATSQDRTRGRVHVFVPLERRTDGTWRQAFNVGRPILDSAGDVRPHEADQVQDRLRWVMSWHPRRGNPPAEDPDELARELEEERVTPGMFASILKEKCGDTPAVRKIIDARRRREREWIKDWIPDLRDRRPTWAPEGQQSGGWLTNPAGDARIRDLERRAAQGDPLAASAAAAVRWRVMDREARATHRRLDGIADTIPRRDLASFLEAVATGQTAAAPGSPMTLIGPPDSTGLYETVSAYVGGQATGRAWGPYEGQPVLHVMESDGRGPLHPWTNEPAPRAGAWALGPGHAHGAMWAEPVPLVLQWAEYVHDTGGGHFAGMDVRHNPDESRRSRERRAKAEGGDAAEAARIADMLRTGALDHAAVAIAGGLGDAAARSALPGMWQSWVRGRFGFHDAATALARPDMPFVLSSAADALRHYPWGPAVADAVFRASAARADEAVALAGSGPLERWRRPMDAAVRYMTQQNYGMALDQAALAWAWSATGSDAPMQSEIDRQRADMIALLLKRTLPEIPPMTRRTNPRATPPRPPRFTLAQLVAMPTLATGQADDLKYDDGTYRVWISRMGLGDAADDDVPQDNLVTVEMFDRSTGRWETVQNYYANGRRRRNACPDRPRHARSGRLLSDAEVLRRFVRREVGESRRLLSDGTRLDGLWMGGRGIAEWTPQGTIEERDLGSAAAQRVQRALRREIRRQGGERRTNPLLAVVGNPGPPPMVRVPKGATVRTTTTISSVKAAKAPAPRARRGTVRTNACPDRDRGLVCSQCGEAAVRRRHPFPRAGWALSVEPERLEYAHRDGEPLCPEMTAQGYQPSLPVPERGGRRENPFWSRKIDKDVKITCDVKKLPHYDEAVRRYEEFHGKVPTHARVIRVDDGKSTVTRKVVVALGEVPETVYTVPWESQKYTGDEFHEWQKKWTGGRKPRGKPVTWVHPHEDGRLPIEVLDPATGITSKLPTSSSTKVTDYWHH